MSILGHAKNVHVEGRLTAIAGDQRIQNNGDQHFAGDQVNYHTSQLRGIDLLQQHSAPAALLDSKARLDQPKCMEGTREAIIDEIMSWVKGGGDSVYIKWIRGPAGSGKTAIEHTVAELCKRQGLLIGTFFFSRAVTNCTNGDLLVPTLALQLSSALPKTEDYIDEAIRKDRLIFTKGLETQMERLIVEPLRRLSFFRWLQHRLGLKPFPRLVVIDGLDECSDRDLQRNILKTISRSFQRLRFPIRILVASRPEPHIERAFEEFRSNCAIPEIDLKEDALARRDIRFYFDTKFAEVRRMHREVPEDWPTPATIAMLVDKASGQFIYASTVMAYITSQYYRPDDRLHVILLLSSPPSTDKPFAQLDCLYSFILRTAKHLENILRIIALLIAAKGVPEEDYNYDGVNTFPSIPRIESLLCLQPGDVRRIFADMHSLIDCRDDAGIKMLHASLPDFLADRSRSEELFIDVDQARATFQVYLMLETELRRLPSGLPARAPTAETISWLVDRAAEPAEYLSTAIAFFISPYHPIDCIQDFLRLSPQPSNDRPFAQIDFLFSFILRSAKHLEGILRIFTLLIAARGVPEQEYNYKSVQTFPSIPRIESLLQLRAGDVEHILTDMYSLVDCQHNSGIKMLHGSFPDFLTDRSRSEELCINVNKANMLFRQCLALETLEGLSNLDFSSLVPQEPYQPAESLDSPFSAALKVCEAAGMLDEYRSTLEKLDLFQKYKDVVIPWPWRRASATTILRLHVAQITEYLGSFFDLEGELRSFWGQYHWGKYAPSGGVDLYRQYYLRGSMPDIEEFLGYLLSEPPSPKICSEDREIAMYEKPGEVAFRFIIEHNQDSSFTVSYVMYQLPYTVDLKALRMTRPKDQEAWAWQVLERAYLMGNHAHG